MLTVVLLRLHSWASIKLLGQEVICLWVPQAWYLQATILHSTDLTDLIISRYATSELGSLLPFTLVHDQKSYVQ